MTRLTVPYASPDDPGGALDFDLPDSCRVVRFVPAEPPPVPDVADAVRQALLAPINSPPLTALLRPGMRVAVLVEDQYRQAPADRMLGPVLDAADRAGAKASVLCATGKAPKMSPDEMRAKVGPAAAGRVAELASTDADAEDDYDYAGVTARGVPLFVHRLAARADLIVTLSTVQATLWGYGGHGMVIPGVASLTTINANHAFVLAPDCRPGSPDSHLSLDKYDAARLARVGFAVHAVTDNAGRVTAVHAGEHEAAHRAAVAEYDRTYRFRPDGLPAGGADVVLAGTTAPTGGAYLQVGWAALNCDPVCKPGGTIIHAAPCPGAGPMPGFGGLDPLAPFLPATPESVARAARAFRSDGARVWIGTTLWKFLDLTARKRLAVVTRPENLGAARAAGFEAADAAGQALEAALGRHGPGATVAFVPYARYSVFGP